MAARGTRPTGGVRRVDLSFVRRRRDERFAQLLDGVAGTGGRPGTDPDEDLTGYAGLVTELRRVGDFAPAPQPEFRAGLRAALVATATREGIGATADPRSVPGPGGTGRRGRRTRGAIIAGLAAGTLALSGISAASGGAMPGDALYGVKRSNEDVRLHLAGSDTSRGQLKLEFAKNRMAEAVAQARGPQPGDGLAPLLDAMDTDVTEGVRLLTSAAADQRDPAPLDLVDAFLAAQRPGLLAMRDTATGPVRGRADVSVALLDEIRARTVGLRATLTCGAAAAPADALGPRPGTCAAGG